MSDKKQCPVGGKGIGGQAVIEGVMMRGKTLYAMAVRSLDTGEIKVEKKFFFCGQKVSKDFYYCLRFVRPCFGYWKLPQSLHGRSNFVNNNVQR